MKSFQKFLALLTIGIQLSATANAGRLQDEDFKSLSDLTAAGGTVSQLLNDTKVYVTANGINSQLSSAITSGKIGGGGGGSKNYLSTYSASLGAGAVNAGNGDFEAGTTTGFTLAHSVISTANGYPLPTSVATAGSAFSASSGGTAAAGTLTLTASTSSPLQKTTSGLLTSSAASTAGDMVVSSAFYIDAADQGKMLTVSADTSVVSGTINQSGTSANTFSWWIYDVTNAQWIQPAGVYNITGSGQTKGVTFQTSTNSTQYQLALINTVATTGAYSFKLDELAVGPQVSNSAPAVSDAVAYTPTGTWTTNTTYTGYKWRRGDREFYEVQVALSGAPTAASLSINTTETMDATKMVNGISTVPQLGRASYYHLGAGTVYEAVVMWNNSNSVSIQYPDPSALNSAVPFAVVNATAPFTAASGDRIVIRWDAPIVGFSSNAVSSADTDTRVVAAYIQGSSIANAATYTFGAATVDTAGGWNGSTTYTVPVSGVYEIGGQMQFTQTSTAGSYYNMGVFKNGSGLALQTKRSNGASTGTDSFPFSTIQAQLKAGDTLTFGMAATNYSTITPSTDTSWFSIKRLSGPAVVQASESVGATYTLNSSVTFPASTATTITGFTKVSDSHGFFNPATGIGIIPLSGRYRVKVQISSGTAMTSTLDLLIQKNGINIANFTGNANPGFVPIDSEIEYPFIAGDTIKFVASTGSASYTTIADVLRCYITISRIGN
jgi:hypothetical protein